MRVFLGRIEQCTRQLPCRWAAAMLLAGLTICIVVGIASPSLWAQTKTAYDTTDLSKMDWSDTPAETSGTTQDAAKTKKADDDFSGMNWADEGVDSAAKLEAETQASEREVEDAFLAKKERTIHLWGFLMFIGYIGGCILTGYFTRNRKLAVHYPPELLIVLHAVWPVELIFLLFAGKKVR